MTTYPSKIIRDAARQVLVQKHKRHIRPLAVTAREIQQLCPGIASTDVENELAALALADRLPKVYEDVLVYSKGEIFIAYLNLGNDWLYYENVSSDKFPVDYWMELPQKPKTE